jgi:hypothetical protein
LRVLNNTVMAMARWLALACLLAAPIRPTDGGVIAKSTLQMCEKKESGGQVNSKCEEKMIVTMDLQNMQAETDSIRTIPAQNCKGDGTKKDDCKAASGAQGEQALTKPLIITASKSRVRLRYPVTYSHMTFNDDPYEIFLCGPGRRAPNSLSLPVRASHPVTTWPGRQGART